jgi:3-hydroxyisobutyrate dehydrogenase
MTIGMVGVGRMGANMARRLKDVGCTVGAIYDANTAVARDLAAELGAVACESLSEVTRRSDWIFTVVSDDDAMRAIFFDAPDSLLRDAAGKTFVNFATVAPATHAEVEAAAAKVGARTLEACMASSITQAREGTLYLMVGGDGATLEQVRPALEKLSASLRHIGPIGSAAKVKALVNMVMNINTAGLAEGLALGDALGLDLTMLRDVFAQTGANSRVLETDGADMQARDHACFFSAAHAAKDSGIALALARESDVITPLADAARTQYNRMVAAGLGELDKSGIAELTFKSRRPAGL